VQLIPWSFHTQHGFTLRGQHSVPSGKPLLHFLHGNGYCSLMYMPLLRQLAPYFDFFLSDVQGHGDSDHGGAFIGWNQSAELAERAFKAHFHLFGNVAVYGCGHSFGGVLTALINASDPKLFRQVILLDPVLFPPLLLNSMRALNFFGLYQRNPMAKKALRRKDYWPSRLDAESYLTNRGMFKDWQPDALNSYIDHALHHTDGVRLKCLPIREAEIFGSYPKALWHKLQQPCAATFVIYGQQSYPFVKKAVIRWQKVNRAVTAEQVTGGHCFMQQYPELTAALMLNHCAFSAD
jgi:pimeloyl-ACP methyl ester carboxylesterase